MLMLPRSIISSLSPCVATYTYVVGLGEKGLKYLNSWYPGCGIVWEGLEGLLGEVYHWAGP